MTAPTQSFAKIMTHGVSWLMLQTVATRIIALVGQLILAKLMMPEDFGILGLATTSTAIFSMFVNVGVDQVLQQRAGRMHLWATQAFWFSLLVSTLTAIAMSVYAPIGAHVYQNPKIMPLIWITAIGLPLQSLSTVSQVYLQAQLRFKFLAAYNSSELLATQLGTIFFAWIGLGSISFVLPLPILALVRAIVLWKKAPPPLRRHSRFRGWKPMSKRSFAVLSGKVSTTLISQGDYMTLGLFVPANIVGLYFFAFKLAAQPMTLLATNFVNVLFPTLTTFANDPSHQRDAAFKTSSFLGVLIIPLCLFQAAVCEPGLILLFGDRWIGSIAFIQILSLGIPLDALSWPAGALMNARGQFGRRSLYQTISAVFFFILVGTGALIGKATGVAWAVAAYYVIHPLTFSLLTYVPEGIAARSVVKAFFMPYAMSMGSALFGYGLSKAAIFHDHLLVQVLVILAISGLSYLAAIRLFMPSMYKEARSRIADLIRRKRKRSSP